MGLDELIAQVYKAPRGPQVAAIVDLDGSLVNACATVVGGFAQYRGRSSEELRKLGQTELTPTAPEASTPRCGS